MFFELQLSSNVFTRMVRNRLKAISLCVDRELPDVDGTPLVVDQVVIGESTWIQREQRIKLVNNAPQSEDSATQLVWIFWPTNYTSFTVPFLQVKQEVLIHLVKAADLEANGPNPTPSYRTLTIYPVFNIALTAANQTQGGGPLTLSYALAYVDFGFLFLVLAAQQRSEVEQAIAAVTLPPTTVDLGPLTGLLKRPVSAINAGIVCDAAGSFVALRVDFDVYKSPVAVDPQFFGSAPADLLAGKDWAMLVDTAVLLEDATAKAKKALQAAPNVKLHSGPTTSWDPGGVAIDIHADIEAVDACPFFVDDIDMDVDVDIRASFSVPAPNTYRSHFHLTGTPSDLGEEVACALTGALLWPFIGPFFLKDEDIGEGLGAYFAGLAAGPVITFFGIIAAIETKKLSKDISEDLGSTCKKLDDENYECNEILNLVMALSPTFNSRLEVEMVYGVPRGLVIGGSVSNLRDLFMGGLEPIHVCPFAWQVVGHCTGNGKSNFQVANQATIDVFGTPPAALCTARVLSDPEREFSIGVSENTVTIVPGFKPSYTAHPYPCRMRVITNRGVRTITLPPPAAIGAAESHQLEDERLSAHLSCYYWEKIFTPIEKIKWLPDPPFRRERFVQFWQIAVKGMQPHESIHIETPAGATVMTAQPSRGGVTHVSLMFRGDEAPAELSLELRGRREQEGEGGRAREIALQQVSFEHRASLPVPGPLRAMRFEGGARSRRLVVVDADREMTWDVSNPLAPTLVHAVAHADSKGRPGVVLHSGKALGAAPTPNLLRALERLQDRLGRPEAIGNPRVRGIAETLYVRTKQGTALFDISGEQPHQIHTYEGPGWYEDVALGGNLMAHHSLSLGVIDLYVAALDRTCTHR
jgi:hypothetical protein